MEAPGPHRQLTLDIEEDVFNHILFHKSLIDDESDDQRLDRYLSVLSQMKEGVHVSIRDTYSRSVAMIMELAIEEYLDPWDIDLVRFCRSFLDRLDKGGRVNLLVVGKLISMAYTVLMLKSVNTLRKAEHIEEVEDEPIDDIHEWMEDDEGFRVTSGILRSEDVLVESLVHKGDRPVTLLDLLNALEEVEDEVVAKRELRVRHAEEVRTNERRNLSEINSKMFAENVEEEIKLTWQRVNQFNGHPIPFSHISRDFELDGTTTFISLLYLAKWSRVALHQRSFPKGEIYVRNIMPGETVDLEFGDLEGNAERAASGDARIRRPEELIVEERPIPGNWNT